jgi:hypothetical protein
MRKRYWLLGAFAVLVVLVALFLWRNQGPKPEEAETLTGDKFTVLKQNVTRISPIGIAYDITLYAPDTLTDSEFNKLSQNAFEGFIGVKAEEAGFTTVVVRRSADRETYYSWAGPRIYFSVGWGRFDPLEGNVVYRRDANGVWRCQGAEPGAPERLSEFTLPSGVRFGLTYKSTDYPKGLYIYDCLSCANEQDFHEATRDINTLFDNILLPDADGDDLNSVQVFVFTGPRSSRWQFPFLLKAHFEKNVDGFWVGSKGSPAEWEQAAVKAFAERRRDGASMRAKLGG